MSQDNMKAILSMENGGRVGKEDRRPHNLVGRTTIMNQLDD